MGFFNAILGNAGEMDLEEATEELSTILGQGEHIELAYKLVRDMIILTDRRLILIDKQGMTGRKVEYRSVPYKSITMYTIETKGHFDLDAELKLWISGQHDPISLEFNGKTNVYTMQGQLAAKIAGK
ncbi:helicase [Photobacterium iliopiscarium]|uniref:PH domain-containing protein n=1 Tax=Photobacterium iliopiscarium TaxID=56192 RepID=A0ABX5GQQ0_9GAMM|nr:PH domain-containing protein [Photobacterium iliopiscarium]KJG13785.1 helicase [Photobacterium iliopiscarium]KJG21006.1 helicase [Photobacterium iliopiscarium]PST87529.1 PH domain-containing protein [Photobacterium iliopiscarium]PSU00842.1 PH domain-containing protein [Photobacterium iliopiscarium]PSV82048.1 PH domain-containing protein [Photobacterium iliopiscarium]